MRQPPTGTVTFLFTDIEGSTKLWQEHPDRMRSALARHDALLRRAITENGGYVFKTVGDAFCAAFATATEAAAAALAAQNSLAEEPWPAPLRLGVRMALHTGSAEERDGDYFGPPLNRVARLMAAGHGGQTLLSLAAQELTRDALPSGAALRDLGNASLKDLGRPERVFQLLHPALAADFPPLRSLDNPALPNNLPQQMTSFIGREAQVAEVGALLAGTRLLTVTGAGGSGKTRLCLQVAADVLEQYPDGAWLVEMAALSDPALVPQAAAQALGVQEQAGRTVLQSLAERLRPKHLLLVLDNCEHLVAACASLASDLLKSCPHIHILATSREPLNVAGEQTYRVPSLSLPDPTQAQAAESLSQYEAVRLFIERARAVQPTFTVTDANAPAVAQVCFHLDGIPLALELAAARVRSLSVEEVNARLGQRFHLLTGGSRDTLPRQQTLRALVDWSYDLLTEPEKALLRRLSAFAGGWTLAAAERVCAGESVEDRQVLDLLTSLVDKSLVVYGHETAGGARYHLLETVRQYAQDRLAERGETTAAGDRHLSWCVALAEETDMRLQGPDQGTWLTHLETEYDNLRAGLAWGVGSPAGAARGLQLASILGRFWVARGYWAEGRGHLMAALAAADTTGGMRERARALSCLGLLARFQGDWGAAQPLYEQSVAIYREIGNRAGEAYSLNGLGLLSRSRGDWEAARAFYGQSLAMCREVGNRNGEANNLNGLGIVARDSGDWETARRLHEQSLAIYRAAGDRQGEANNLNNLGTVARDLGDWEAARALHAQALAICREVGNRGSEAWSLHNLGCLAQLQGDWAAAGPLHEQSLAIYQEIGDPAGRAYGLKELGGLARAQGRAAEARSLLAQSLTCWRRLLMPWSTLAALEEWAALALAEDDPVCAARLAGAAQAGWEAIPTRLPPDQGGTRERTLSAARAALGDAAFTIAWNAGRAMTLDEAVKYALGEE